MATGTKLFGNHVAWFVDALKEAFVEIAEQAGVAVSEIYLQFESDPMAALNAIEGLDWDNDIAGPFKKKYADLVRKNHGPTMNRTAAHLGITNAFGPSETSVYAEAYIREHGATMVSEVNDNTKTAIREMISDDILHGRNPRSTARRLEKEIGLLPQHSKAVQRHKEFLLEGGMPFSKAQKSADKYAKKLLRYRANNIARTEAITAQNQAQLDSWRESIRQGHLPETVQRIWITAPDERRCRICARLEGTIISIEGEWNVPSIKKNEPKVLTGKRVERPPAHNSCRCTQGLVFRQ